MGTGITVSAQGPAPADRVWGLLARPSDWPAWAPHMWHVSGPGDEAPTAVHEGQRLRLRFPLVDAAIPLEVTEVDAPHGWTMVASVPLLGRVASSHRIRTVGESGGGTVVEVTVAADRSDPVTAVALQAYRPVAAVALRRLLSLAGGEAAGAAFNRFRMCQRDDG